MIIKIGGDIKKDLREIWEDPRKAEPNTHTLYLKTAADLYEILSPKRLELLMHIIKHQSQKKTISELAKELKRKQEAISRDASFLAMHQMIKKIKKSRTVYLKALYKSLDIRLASS